MEKKGPFTVVLAAGLSFFIAETLNLQAAEKGESPVLLDFGAGFDAGRVEAQGAAAAVSDEGALRIKADGVKPVEIHLKAPDGKWDLSRYLYVAMDVRNAGADEVMVTCRVNNNRWVDGSVWVPAGQTRVLKVLLRRNRPAESVGKELFGMNGLPGGYVWTWEPIDVAKIAGLFISVAGAKAGQIVEVDNVRASGWYNPPSQEELDSSFFPFIDVFGQYIHGDWPGKTDSVEELGRHYKKELADLAEHSGPAGWNKYGGWAAGPKLEATGHFRVEKYKGKWWLVDPTGRLFWSHGIDCVRSGNATPVSDREHYFRELPQKESALAKFYGTSGWAPHGYYKNRGPYRTYDFGRANLFRKYGRNWRQRFSDITHRRLRSWGMNTIANWSEPEIYLQRRTAYVGTLNSAGRSIEASKGVWRRFPDPFDAGFSESLRERLQKERDKSATDSWCIGYFVDNELSWGDEVFLALSCLASPADQPAKKAFVDELKAKYGTIEGLNTAWAAKYASWDGLLQSRKRPDRDKAYSDLVSFNTKIAEQYFATIRKIIKAEAPDKLYLGCRFDFHFYPEEQQNYEWLIRVAGKFCDVISFNRYRYRAWGLRPPEGVDKLIIIGEWHMGALDRGLFHTGLRSVASQAERSEAYKSYVRGALQNRYIVGVHWFQYKDQPTTGRGDGENYQIGFLDICDTPYPETTEACREVGYGLYEYRLNSK